VRLVHPRLERIADKYSVSVMLWQLVSPSRALLVDLAESRTPIRVHISVGQRLPSLIGALGRCFAAHLGLPKERVRAIGVVIMASLSCEPVGIIWEYDRGELIVDGIVHVLGVSLGLVGAIA